MIVGITQAQAGKTQLELGSLAPTRDFSFVTDTVRAFLHAATTPGIEGEVMNSGSGKEISIGDLVRLIGEVIGKDITVKKNEARVRPTNSEVERLMANAARLTEKTGWRPEVTLKEGIAKTVAWLSQPRRGYDADRYHL
jgi:nucleoside-diphosphate-sugar epimerase